jgi:hypothetical protein
LHIIHLLSLLFWHYFSDTYDDMITIGKAGSSHDSNSGSGGRHNKSSYHDISPSQHQHQHGITPRSFPSSSSSSSPSTSSPTSSSSSNAYQAHRQTGVIEGRIFIGSLPDNCSRDTIRSYFDKYGDIIDAYIPRDKHTKQPKNYGFITFRDMASVKAV